MDSQMHNFTPTKYSTLCSEYFRPEDYQIWPGATVNLFSKGFHVIYKKKNTSPTSYAIHMIYILDQWHRKWWTACRMITYERFIFNSFFFKVIGKFIFIIVYYYYCVYLKQYTICLIMFIEPIRRWICAMWTDDIAYSTIFSEKNQSFATFQNTRAQNLLEFNLIQ